MRTQSEKGGDGPSIGVHIPTPYRWDWSSPTCHYGSRFRRKYGSLVERNKMSFFYLFPIIFPYNCFKFDFQLDDINQLFLPHMRNKLLWYYQDVEEIEHQPVPEGTKTKQVKPPPPIITLKKKLFLSDGWDVRFTGVCIYMFRINVSKQLPEEGFHKDL